MTIPSINRAWVRWAARVAGGVSLAYCAQNTLGDTPKESRVLPVLLLFAALAYLVAWWREIEGGTALATIAVALGGVAFTVAGKRPFVESLALSLPLFLSGGLFYLAGAYAFQSDAVPR
jgi:hypothetical protein